MQRHISSCLKYFSPVYIDCQFSLFSPYTVTACAADLPSTTVVPTTHSTSTPTAAPVTNASTAPPPTTTPTPTLPTPSTGKYSIKPDENSTACLLANFGLRIGYKQAEACSETQNYNVVDLVKPRQMISHSPGWFLIPFSSLWHRNMRRWTSTRMGPLSLDHVESTAVSWCWCLTQWPSCSLSPM